jgi:ribosome-associated protein YbcJ (S4-like RNA binding protein)
VPVKPGAPTARTVPPVAAAKPPRERPLDGEGRPYITLVQFLKTIDAVGTGGAGKHAVRAGGMLVNGSEELRPGRKLHEGDTVTVAGVEHRVTL